MLLVLVLCLSLLPTAALAAEPDTRHTIQPGASAINGWSADDGYDYIYLGNWNNKSVKWRVLSANGDTASSYNDTPAGSTRNKQQALFMLSEDVLEQTQFGDNWCNKFKSKALTATEQLAVFTTVSKEETSQTINSNIYSYGKKPISLLPRAGSAVLFLSATEAKSSAYGFSNNDARIATGGAWWLISRATKGAGTFGTIDSKGAFSSEKSTNTAGARPALNLDKRQVLFTSAANNSSHKDFPSAPGNYTGHDFKLTIKDSNTFAEGAKIVGGRTT